MKAYKGFNKDMTCRGFQFEEGKTYELPKGETAKLCESGFHACEAPLDCFGYYAPTDAVYHEVELDGVTDEVSSEDSKRVGSKIKIGAKLDIAGIVKAQIESTKEKCETKEKGGYMAALTGGDRAALTGGDRAALTGGNMAALTGGYRAALTGGDRAALTGGYMAALTGGNMAALTGGDMSALTGGYMAALTGGYRAVMRGGQKSKFRGGMWSVFAVEIRDDDYNLIGMKTGVVDGETLKPDVWYTLKDGEFVEAEDDA